MDQSQKAHEPLPVISPGELMRQLQGQGLEVLNEEAAEAIDSNRRQAGSELSSIFSLQGSSDFRWYEKEFVIAPYEEAFRKLRDPGARAPEETLEIVQAQYLVLRKVRAGMLEREITHRETVDPRDEMITKLRDQLNFL